MYDIKYDIGVSDKEHFHKKNYTENVQQKLVPDVFIILVNNLKQPLHARNYKKVTFFFLNPVPFNRQNSKTNYELMTSCFSGYKTSSEKFLY